MKTPGVKIEELNLNSMNAKRILFTSLLLFSSLQAATPSREGVALQDLRTQCEDLTRLVHTFKVEQDLLHERIETLSQALQESKKSSSSEWSNDRLGVIEKRLALLEKTQEALAADIKASKSQLHDNASSLTALDKQLTFDIKSLKSTLQSLVSLLQPDSTTSPKTYVVRPGDSLGKIALDQKVNLKQLKELNQLASDQIRVGQKLQLP